jgi:enterochelin esterase-like enzyme
MRGLILSIGIALLVASCTSNGAAPANAGVQWDTISGVSSGTLLRLDSAHATPWLSARPLDIWLPRTYDGKRKHAVLYMYDAQMLFDAKVTWNHQEWRVDEVLDSLIAAKTILPTIVVGLHNGGMMRNFEYFPQKPFNTLKSKFSDSTMADIAMRYGSDSTFPVQSDKYLQYMVEGVKPLVDSAFAVYTDKSATAVAGSSMGGLMSIYAIGEYPEVFGTALCMSTHWPGGFAPNEEIPNAFEAYVAEYLRPERVGKIYFDYGTETLDGMYEPFQNQINEVLLNNGFESEKNWTTQKFPGAAHDEKSWAKRLHIPFTFAFAKQR